MGIVDDVEKDPVEPLLGSENGTESLSQFHTQADAIRAQLVVTQHGGVFQEFVDVAPGLFDDALLRKGKQAVDDAFASSGLLDGRGFVGGYRVRGFVRGPVAHTREYRSWGC